MGYSCTKDASEMLGLIRNQFTDGQTSNGLRIGAATFFYEIGREQADGSITGTLFENVDETHARRYGSFKINVDGTIARFPGIRRDMRISMYFRFLELQRVNPTLLSSYSRRSI
jgi:hypothetical protein